MQGILSHFFLGRRWINNQRKSNCAALENNRAYLLRTEITKSHINNRICEHCGVKTSTVTRSISLSCNINIPSFIGNLWWDRLLGNHLKLSLINFHFSKKSELLLKPKEHKFKMKQKDITESRPLKNIARENAKNPEKKKRAYVTSCRPVNRTVNHKIPCVRRVHKHCFLLRQPKRSAIHRRRIDVISRVILTKLYCLKIGQM